MLSNVPTILCSGNFLVLTTAYMTPVSPISWGMYYRNVSISWRMNLMIMMTSCHGNNFPITCSGFGKPPVASGFPIQRDCNTSEPPNPTHTPHPPHPHTHTHPTHTHIPPTHTPTPPHTHHTHKLLNSPVVLVIWGALELMWHHCNVGTSHLMCSLPHFTVI